VSCQTPGAVCCVSMHAVQLQQQHPSPPCCDLPAFCSSKGCTDDLSCPALAHVHHTCPYAIIGWWEGW
jgi:hypothetical protein